MIANIAKVGGALVRRVIPQAAISGWREIADLHYARIEFLVQREGIEAVLRQLPQGQRYLPHVSSINLETVYGAAECQRILKLLGGAVLPRSPDLTSCAHALTDEVGRGAPLPSRLVPSKHAVNVGQASCLPGERFSASGVGGTEAEGRQDACPTLLLECIEHALGGPVVCDLDQAWVRRQYAVHRRPPGHVAHSWHQDGALLYPFDPTGARAPDADGLLRMVTCWVALTPCGQNAPGLELVRQHLDSLLPPSELTDSRVCARCPAELFWRPVMEPGDVLLFDGSTLHRTHVEPHMEADRTSIELRFFPAHSIPERLAGDRFSAVPPGTPVACQA